MKILLIEDDKILNDNIAQALQAEGYTVFALFDGTLMERKTKKEKFDCVILDVNLPGINGFELCKQLRTYDLVTPVIMLTAFSELEDKINGFNAGADDYLSKPFFMRELILRVRNLIKRSTQSGQTSTQQNLYFDDIVLNTAQKKVFRNQIEIELTPREFNILYHLMQKPHEVISKKELVSLIWGQAVDFNTNTIEVYINFLRNKLDKPFGKNTIKTKIGYGYYLA
jgi:DNA-binding response OmpR family regulator